MGTEDTKAPAHTTTDSGVCEAPSEAQSIADQLLGPRITGATEVNEQPRQTTWQQEEQRQLAEMYPEGSLGEPMIHRGKYAYGLSGLAEALGLPKGVLLTGAEVRMDPFVLYVHVVDPKLPRVNPEAEAPILTRPGNTRRVAN